MEDLTENQKKTLETVRAAGGPVVLAVSATRGLVAKGLIKPDGSAGHGRAKAAYTIA